jgi:hypothetical protein
VHISDEIGAGFTDMEKKLKLYVDKGRVPGAVEVREEPAISVKPERFRIKPLEKVSSFCGVFVAVDCSTRTLKRANNWGVYLMRAAYASLKSARLTGGTWKDCVRWLGTHVLVVIS